jgi:hypothetical protein
MPTPSYETWENMKKNYDSMAPVDVRTEQLELEKYRTRHRQFQGIPGVEVAANGRLWATWYSGGTGEGAENSDPVEHDVMEVRVSAYRRD